MLRPTFCRRIQALAVRSRCFSSSAAAAQVSDQEVTRFEEDGATVIRQLFSPEWVEKLRDLVEVNMKNPGRIKVAPVLSLTKPGRFHDDQFLWTRHEVGQKFLFESPAAEAAKRLIRILKVTLTSCLLEAVQRKFRLFYDQLFVKEPGTRTTTPWHNDHSYWPLIGDQVVSLWFALDYVPKSSCVQYVRGSHKWKLMHKVRSFAGNESRYEAANQDSKPEMPDIDNWLDEVELLTWDMEPGDCLVHHSFAVHGAPGISENGNRRRAYVTRWVRESVLFDPRPGNEACPCHNFYALFFFSFEGIINIYM